MNDDSMVAAIERATLAALPPQRQETWGGWLLACDDGPVGRAHSAVPLTHRAQALGSVAEVAARYRAAGLRPLLRLPRVAGFEGLAGGWTAASPTVVETARCAELKLRAAPHEVKLAAHADDAWCAAFLGACTDAAEAAGRVAVLRRSRGALFASVEVDGLPVAVGMGCGGQGWFGIHGMRTQGAHRGRGMAGAILAALVARAPQFGAGGVFLQVEEGNDAARRLYRGAGFLPAWSYDYWGAPAP